jgi:hypothetical protein
LDYGSPIRERLHEFRWSSRGCRKLAMILDGLDVIGDPSWSAICALHLQVHCRSRICNGNPLHVRSHVMQDVLIELAAVISRNERHAQWQSAAPSERDRLNAKHLSSWQPPTPSQREGSRVTLSSRPPIPLMASFQRPE